MEDAVGGHDSVPHQRELVDLGLTSYEARTYLALLRRHGLVAADLGREAGVPRQRIYDVLAGLVETRARAGTAGPGEALCGDRSCVWGGRLMAGHRLVLGRFEHTTMRLVESLVPVWSGGRLGAEPLDYVVVIGEGRVLAERLAELQSTAEFSWLTLAKAPYLIVDNPDGLQAAARLAEAGGDARCVYESAGLESPGVTADIGRFVAAGGQARVAASVPIRLCIADGARVLMSLPDSVVNAPSSVNVLIEHPALALCLTYAFETIWAQAQPFDSAAGDLAGRARV
jgi:hypothetical protein